MNTKIQIFVGRIAKKGVLLLITGMFSVIGLASYAQTPGQPKWNPPASAAGAVRGSPAIGLDGTIYITADDGDLYAIDPATGVVKPNWPIPLNNTRSYEDELLSSPVIAADGTIYVASSEGNLYDINPDATVKWVLALPLQFRGFFNYAGCSVAVAADGTVYVTYDDDDKLYAVNPQGNNGNGSIKWMLQLHQFDSSDSVFIDSNPSIGPDCTIYFYVSEWSESPNGNRSSEKLVAVTDGGIAPTIQWTYDLGFSEDINDFRNSPVIGASGTIFVPFGSAADSLIAINPDGSGKWKFQAGGAIKSSPAIGPDGTIYFGSDDNNLYALNPDGTQKWMFSQATGAIESSAAVASDGTLYVGSSDNNLYTINSANGSLIRSFATGAPITSSPLIAADGTVYFGSEDGNIYALYGTTGLAASDWPMFRKNPAHTASQSQANCSAGHCAHLGNAVITDTTFSFDCFGQPNSQCEIFESTDLQNWTGVSSVTLDSFGYGSFVDNNVTGVAHRFYKLSNGECCSQALGFERLQIAANSSRYIANQLDTLMNTLDGLFNPMPDGTFLPTGTQIAKYQGGSSSTYTWNGTSWSGNPSLAPGEGAIVANNSGNAFTVTFVGLVREGTLTHTLASGANFVSSFIPQAGGIKSVLGYAPAASADDFFTIWDNVNHTSVQREYYTGGPGKPAGWYDINNNPVAEPVVDVGESFFVTPSTGDQWVQNYVACPCDVPVVFLTAPASGTVFCPNDPIILTADASEQCGTINSVSFYAGATLLRTVTTPPYTYTWTTATPGTYSLTAKVTDNHAVVVTSGPVSVSVQAVPPPTIVLTSPGNGSVYCPNTAPVVLSADASVGGCGTINSVSFYAGGTLLNTTTTSPYTYTWVGAAPGTYSLTAKVTDRDGQTTTSTPVTVRVDSQPTVVITSVVTNGPGSAWINVSTSDTDGTLTKVDFYAGSTLIGSTFGNGFDFNWVNAPCGTYTITARGTDNDGCQKASLNSMPLVIGQYPSINLTSPANGSIYYPNRAPIVLSANASEGCGGTISSVAFYSGTTLLSTVTHAPYNYVWFGASPGTYSLTAKVTDNHGVTATTAPVSVKMDALPTVVITGINTSTPGTVSIGVFTSDNDGSVVRVDYYASGNNFPNTLIGSTFGNGFDFTWNNVAPGTYNIYAIATDNDGGQQISNTATATVH